MGRGWGMPALSSTGPILQQHPRSPRDVSIAGALNATSKLYPEQGFCKLGEAGKYLSGSIKPPHPLNSHLRGLAGIEPQGLTEPPQEADRHPALQRRGQEVFPSPQAMNSHRHLLQSLAGRQRKALPSFIKEERGAELVWFITPPRTPVTPDWRQLLAEAEHTPPQCPTCSCRF